MIATYAGNLNIVKDLISNGADPNSRENKGFTPFIAACANYALCTEIINFYRKLKNPRVNLHARSFDG